MNISIFIVDDDKNIQKMLEMFIKKEKLGILVGTQDSGMNAAEDILFLQPDIVLLDLLLPGKDGIHVLEEIMRGGFKGKVIMISQVDDTVMMEKAYERGIMFYINKPLNPIEVTSVISNVAKLVHLQKSMDTIQGALLGIQETRPVNSNVLNDRFLQVCSDIGIMGMKGLDDLKEIVFLALEHQKDGKSYQMKELYETAALRSHGEEQLLQNRKALEQRVRRIILKALENIAHMGAEDYYDPIFVDYANRLFDFGQVRTRMRHLEDANADLGRISAKKFIEGICHCISK